MSEPTAPAELIPVGPLVLRRLRSEDLDELARAVQQSLDHLRPWLRWAARPARAEQQAFLAGAVRGWERGERYEYAILEDRGALIGGVGLMRRAGPGVLEIGYWVHSDRVRRGVATLAAAAVTDAAFALPGTERVEIHHDEANLASGRVPARLGFEMVRSVSIEPSTPAESGRDLIWALQRASYPASSCRAILARASG